MNLPAINNKMKNHNSQLKQQHNSFNADGFGLGIQVFKIESAKNIDVNLKSKNRNMIKNIENPTQTVNYKPPLVPKPKVLPSLQKSSSQINQKQRMSAFINTKLTSGLNTGYSDKIMQRKTAIMQSNTIVTPASFSMRKKVGVSTQKNININQTTKGNYLKGSIKEYKQKQIPKVGISKNNQQIQYGKLNQTAPSQTMYKAEQVQYQNYHAQHQVIGRFYLQLQNSEKQHLKQIRQLKKLKQNEQNEEVFDRIEYLKSLQGKIESAIQNMEKQQFQEKNKKGSKPDDKKAKKLHNSIVPIAGFQFNQYEMFEYNSIQDYHIMGDFNGYFNTKNYQIVDLAPLNVQNYNNRDE